MGPPAETIYLNLAWVVQARKEGKYNLNVSASSSHNEIDPQHSSVQSLCEFHVVKGTPVISAVSVLNAHYVPEIDQQSLFVYPNQEIEVECIVTCSVELRNVTLFYRIDKDDAWHTMEMKSISQNAFLGRIPKRREGDLIVFYIEAVSLVGKISKSIEYKCVVADLEGLYVKTNIIKVATMATIVASCFIVLILKRRSLKE